MPGRLGDQAALEQRRQPPFAAAQLPRGLADRVRPGPGVRRAHGIALSPLPGASGPSGRASQYDAPVLPRSSRGATPARIGGGTVAALAGPPLLCASGHRAALPPAASTRVVIETRIGKGSS